ncbi:MAG: endonuclease/exonuclease/phosphatase family protein [Ardenticatenaceae bacterium]
MITNENTTVRLLAYNTHLFGNAFPGNIEQYQDEWRATLIAEKLKNSGADFIGLSEVWDDDMAQLIITGVEEVYPHYYMPQGHGGLIDRLYSGLLLLSKCPLNEPTFTEYDNLTPSEALSHKGFARARVEISSGGRPIELVLVLTHMQAGQDNQNEIAKRMDNIIQLNDAIEHFQEQNPAASVLAFGDFNVIGEDEQGVPTLEYGEMIGHFESTQLTDSFRELWTNAEQKPGFTYDGPCNKLIHEFAPKNDKVRRRLDYVFYSTKGNDDVTLTVTEGKVLTDYTFENNPMDLMDLSDHYPLLVKVKVDNK